MTKSNDNCDNNTATIDQEAWAVMWQDAGWPLAEPDEPIACWQIGYKFPLCHLYEVSIFADLIGKALHPFGKMLLKYSKGTFSQKLAEIKCNDNREFPPIRDRDNLGGICRTAYPLLRTAASIRRRLQGGPVTDTRWQKLVSLVTDYDSYPMVETLRDAMFQLRLKSSQPARLPLPPIHPSSDLESAIASTQQIADWCKAGSGLEDKILGALNKIIQPPEDHDDPIVEALSPQQAKIYEFLSGRKRRTAISTVQGLPGVFRETDPPVDTAIRALRRLQSQLNEIPGARSLSIDVKSGWTQLS